MAEFADSLARLPVLGVGVSLSLGTQPDPVTLSQRPGGPDFVEYAGAVDVSVYRKQIETLQKHSIPMLYHPSCLNLCGPWPNPPHWLAQVNQHVQHVQSAWLAQDVSVCFTGDVPGYSIDLGYFVPPILTQASLTEAIERVGEVRAAVDAPLLLEPAPITCQVGEMSIFSWLTQLAQATDCGLLLDAGHVVSHQLAQGKSRTQLTHGLDDIDWDRVVEVHVAGGIIESHPEHSDRAYYLDAHDLPVLDETWMVFRHILEHAKHLKAVCFECESADVATILWMLGQVRERVIAGTAHQALKAHVLEKSQGTQP